MDGSVGWREGRTVDLKSRSSSLARDLNSTILFKEGTRPVSLRLQRSLRRKVEPVSRRINDARKASRLLRVYIGVVGLLSCSSNNNESQMKRAEKGEFWMDRGIFGGIGRASYFCARL